MVVSSGEGSRDDLGGCLEPAVGQSISPAVPVGSLSSYKRSRDFSPGQPQWMAKMMKVGCLFCRLWFPSLCSFVVCCSVVFLLLF